MKDNAELNFIALMKHKHKHGLILNCLFETTFTFRSILLFLDRFVNLSSECKGNCRLKGNSLQEKKRPDASRLILIDGKLCATKPSLGSG